MASYSLAREDMLGWLAQEYSRSVFGTGGVAGFSACASVSQDVGFSAEQQCNATHLVSGGMVPEERLALPLINFQFSIVLSSSVMMPMAQTNSSYRL